MMSVFVLPSYYFAISHRSWFEKDEIFSSLSPQSSVLSPVQLPSVLSPVQLPSVLCNFPEEHAELGLRALEDAEDQVTAGGTPGQGGPELRQAGDLAVGDVGDDHAELQAAAIGRAIGLDPDDDQALDRGVQ